MHIKRKCKNGESAFLVWYLKSHQDVLNEIVLEVSVHATSRLVTFYGCYNRTLKNVYMYYFISTVVMATVQWRLVPFVPTEGAVVARGHLNRQAQ